MAFDKARYERATEVQRQAAQVAAAAVALATKYRKHPPAFDGGARHNRT
jgi:ABC-type thiamine transport system ATPase subunit